VAAAVTSLPAHRPVFEGILQEPITPSNVALCALSRRRISNTCDRKNEYPEAANIRLKVLRRLLS
jgi:hypothetical protein